MAISKIAILGLGGKVHSQRAEGLSHSSRLAYGLAERPIVFQKADFLVSQIAKTFIVSGVVALIALSCVIAAGPLNGVVAGGCGAGLSGLLVIALIVKMKSSKNVFEKILVVLSTALALIAAAASGLSIAGLLPPMTLGLALLGVSLSISFLGFCCWGCIYSCCRVTGDGHYERECGGDED